MGTLDWRGDALYNHISTAAENAMESSLRVGVDAAKAKSRVGPTERYQAGWDAEPVEIRGDTIHGEIYNEAENDDGHMYGLYVTAGTWKMDGDFAHIAALDAAGSDFVQSLNGIVG